MNIEKELMERIGFERNSLKIRVCYAQKQVNCTGQLPEVNIRRRR